MKDICIANQGTGLDLLMKIGTTLGNAGVNIAGLTVVMVQGQSLVHLAVEEEITAKHALEQAGIPITAITDVYVLEKDNKKITGKPGSFGAVCSTLSENGIEILFGYPAENNRYIFGLSDSGKARSLLG